MILTKHPVMIGALLSLTLMTGCAGDKQPLKIGFIGGLTGRTADLGTGGRNGVQIAVDQINAQGGIRGRMVELILKDDANDPDKAKIATQELIDAKVEVVLGPMTSNVAVAIEPVATQAKVLMIGGSVTTNDLTGKDDYFFRTIAASTVHAATMADFLVEKRGIRSVAAAVNLSNKAYSESWIQNFDRAFTVRGGKPAQRVTYTSSTNTDFPDLARQLLKSKPDAVILVTNAVDAALFANQLRRQKAKTLMVTAEWAGTGKLTELGGSNVEGYIVTQYLDPQGATPEYQAFRDKYKQRFQQDVGFPGVVAYNAAQVAFRSLAEKKSGESLKQTVLRLRTFPGLQGNVVFDESGDVQSKTFLTEIKNGQYVLIQ